MLIAYGSLTDSKIPSVDVQNIDKLYHATAYFIMTVLWYIFFYHRFLERQLHFKYNLILTIIHNGPELLAIAAAIFSLVIGGLIELGQGFISQNRTMDVYDMVANATGIIIALIVLWLIIFD